MGPPGAGKGTQAKILAEKYNLIHLSTGDILRAEIGKKTHTGLEAQSYMDAGNLVPDKVLLSMMESYINRASKFRYYFRWLSKDDSASRRLK